MSNTNISNFKMLMKESKLTTRQIEKYTGVDHSTLSYFASEKRKMTSKTMKRLATFFNVTTDFLIGVSNEGIYCNTEEGISLSLTLKEYDEAKEKIQSFVVENKAAELQIGEDEPYGTVKYNIYREISNDAFTLIDSSGAKKMPSMELNGIIDQLTDKQKEKVLKFIKDYIL